MDGLEPLAGRLSGLAGLRLAAWVYDAERFRVAWANASAATLWRAESVEELQNRDFSKMSDATRTRIDGYLSKFRQEPGSCIEEEWTFYPQGVPMRVRCFHSGIDTDDGRLAMFCEAHGVPASDSRGLRGLEALRHVSAMVTLIDHTGAILVANPAAERAFGEANVLADWFVDKLVAERLLSAIASEEVFRDEVVALTSNGPRFHAIEAKRTLDPASGGDAIVVHQVDLTERREREALIEQQRAEILALSAPLLDIAEGVIAVPIVAELDEARSQSLVERVVTRVSEKGSRVVLLDVTGVRMKGEFLMDSLLRLVHAIRLMGARAVLTGIRPELAKQLISQGEDLSALETRRSLKDALSAVGIAGKLNSV